MKIEWNKKYTTIAIYAALVALFIIIIIFVGVHFENISNYIKYFTNLLKPIMYGFVFAFLLNPILKFCESKIFKFIVKKKPRHKLRRGLSVLLTVIIVLTLLTIFVLIIIPQVTVSYNDLQSKMSYYVATAQKWVEDLVRSSKFFADQYKNVVDSINNIIQSSYQIIQNIIPSILNFIMTFFTEAKNFFFGFILSIYFLLSKEKLSAQIKKVFSAIFSLKTTTKIVDLAKFTHSTFGEFLSGKILDATIIGILCFIFMMIFKMPYYPLISLIIATTNVIPFLGPFLGAIPSVFIIFIADPMAALWFILLILGLQQLDSNFIEPRILGSKTGLAAVWVLISVIVMGGLMGILGMFIGVPTFAVIYVLFKKIIENRLAKKGLPEKTEDYLNK